jgi:hypothetical protein
MSRQKRVSIDLLMVWSIGALAHDLGSALLLSTTTLAHGHCGAHKLRRMGYQTGMQYDPRVESYMGIAMQWQISEHALCWHCESRVDGCFLRLTQQPQCFQAPWAHHKLPSATSVARDWNRVDEAGGGTLHAPPWFLLRPARCVLPTRSDPTLELTISPSESASAATLDTDYVDRKVLQTSEQLAVMRQTNGQERKHGLHHHSWSRTNG